MRVQPVHVAALHILHTDAKGHAMSTKAKQRYHGIRKIARIEDKASSTFLEVIDFPLSNTKNADA
jgi:hypothetical protein